MRDASLLPAYYQAMADKTPAEGMRPWTKHGSEYLPSNPIFRQRIDEMENPRTGGRMRALVLETLDWVNVVARDTRGDYVLVRQYRFGSARIATELPGGAIESGEEPLVAGQRELLEETGYSGGTWTALGASEPNPAFLSNLCHHFLAEGVELTGEQELDSGEDIEVITMDEARLLSEVHSGSMRHALVLAALGRVLDLRGEHGK